MLRPVHLAALGALALATLSATACRRRASSAASAPAASGDYEIRLDEHFVFQPSRIVCAPGQSLRLRLINALAPRGADLAHNFVVLRAGTDVNAFARAGVDARADQNYIPESFQKDVLGQSALVHPGQTLEFALVAPSAAGEYPFVCAFPGHCILGMQGLLSVQPSSRPPNP